MVRGSIEPQVDALIRLALAEDIGTGDVTTRATIGAEVQAAAYVIAKQDLVLAGMDAFCRVFEIVNPDVLVSRVCGDGDAVSEGTIVARLSGPARSLLVGERPALNLLQRLSGTATLTRRFVEAIAGTGARITDTRKTTPGMRVLQKRAVAAGGGSNHRFGLDSGILIKDNHIAACGGLAQAVTRCRASAPHGLKVEVEARTMDEVEEAIAVNADIIMLDNMSLEMTRAAVAKIRASTWPTVIEASGSLVLGRVRGVAECGVDLLSVGALTHSAMAADLSMKFPVGA